MKVLFDPTVATERPYQLHSHYKDVTKHRSDVLDFLLVVYCLLSFSISFSCPCRPQFYTHTRHEPPSFFHLSIFRDFFLSDFSLSLSLLWWREDERGGWVKWQMPCLRFKKISKNKSQYKALHYLCRSLGSFKLTKLLRFHQNGLSGGPFPMAGTGSHPYEIRSVRRKRRQRVRFRHWDTPMMSFFGECVIPVEFIASDGVYRMRRPLPSEMHVSGWRSTTTKVSWLTGYWKVDKRKTKGQINSY